MSRLNLTVRSLTIRSNKVRAHDVTAACRLAMPEVRVQLPLGACGGVRAGTGRRLLTAPTQVRFLSPQLESVATEFFAAKTQPRTRRSGLTTDYTDDTDQTKSKTFLLICSDFICVIRAICEIRG